MTASLARPQGLQELGKSQLLARRPIVLQQLQLLVRTRPCVNVDTDLVAACPGVALPGINPRHTAAEASHVGRRHAHERAGGTVEFLSHHEPPRPPIEILPIPVLLGHADDEVRRQRRVELHIPHVLRYPLGTDVTHRAVAALCVISSLRHHLDTAPRPPSKYRRAKVLKAA